MCASVFGIRFQKNFVMATGSVISRILIKRPFHKELIGGLVRMVDRLIMSNFGIAH
jgi:hypothetical protein